MRLRCISAGRFADATNNGNLVFVEVGEVWERVPYISISGSPYARLNSWVCEGELVRCDGCVNWGALAGNYSPDWCPVVQKHTRPTDWCCWGAGKGESDER